MFTTKDKIFDLQSLIYLQKQWRLKGDKIVFTNGCFDILHIGHVDLLERAAHLGKRLIVGMNSDASVKRLKGAERPIFDEESRSRILAALEFVDAVILFDEDTPQNLIENLLPDVLVKGADYTPGQVAGAEIVIKNGGELKLLDLVPGKSSSAVIRKIQEL